MLLLKVKRTAMPMGGSGSKARAVGVCGVAGPRVLLSKLRAAMPMGGSKQG